MQLVFNGTLNELRETIQCKATEHKKDIVIYNQDDSYTEYAGQAVVFSVTLLDGSQMEVTAYNPFVIIDGVGYKCKYEPCEELNDFANELLNDSKME